jgi:hypothetical protein
MKKETKQTKQTKQKEKTMVISKSEYDRMYANMQELVNMQVKMIQLTREKQSLKKVIELHNSKWYNRKIKF